MVALSLFSKDPGKEQRQAWNASPSRNTTEMAGISKSKDGAPQWDGDSSTYQDYEEQALQWEQSIAYHKRYLAGPRLVSELSGAARKHVVGKRPEWLSYDGDVGHLLRHLRACLGRPTIPELTEFLNKFFRQSKRRRFETMNQYITRKLELYHRARQALSGVQGHYEHASQQREHQWQGWSWHSNSRWWYDAQQEATSDAERSDAVTARESDDEEPANSQGQATQRTRTRSHGQGRGSGYWQWQSNHSGISSYDAHDDEPWKLHTAELLPEFLQGWYLMIDAGLDSTARNMIQTALKDDYSVLRVSQELRQQWPDDDLKKFDQQNRGSAYMQDEIYFEDDDDAHSDDLSSEDQALFGAAEKDAQEAYAMIQQGRRTLREARTRQHQLRLSRQYYKTPFQKDKTQVKTTTTTTSSGTSSTCLKCGRNHRTSDCPDRGHPREQAQQGHVVEEAPFVRFTEDPLACTAQEASAVMSTKDAISAGYGVIDGGATRTLGSVAAIQAVMDINQNKYGHHGISEVDTSNKPVFGFGNSSQDQCVSTAQLNIQANERPGKLQIHALNQGHGPILISIDTLRKLKAVIDFSEDLMVLRGIDDTKIIPLERSAAGHQLLPLTEDLMKHAQPSTSQVPSLRSYCR